MDNKIAIDFGTSRTKVAYFDPVTQRPQEMQLGRKNSILSMFYVDPASLVIHVGDDAVDRLTEYNSDSHIHLLKRKLQQTLRVQNQPITSRELLAHLFREIRLRAGDEIICFDGQAPTAVVLTTTAMYAKSEKATLLLAAEQADFQAIALVEEPVAAAQGWLAARPESQSRDIIVLDCGGGTVDWTYLRRENEQFRLDSSVLSGAVKVGGCDIDDALMEHVISQLQLPNGREDVSNALVLEQQCCTVKEQYCAGIKLSSIKIKGIDPLNLEDSEIQAVIDETFIKPVCDAFAPYLENVRAHTRLEVPQVLLVGGSAKIKGLREALSRLNCKPLEWDRAEIAPVLGAVYTFTPELSPHARDASAPQSATVVPAASPQASTESQEREHDAPYELAVEAVNTDKFDEALVKFQEVLAIEPTHADSYAGIAAAHLGCNRLSDAARAAREAIKFERNHALGQQVLDGIVRIYLSRGAVHMERGNYVVALSEFKEALAIDPNDAKTLRSHNEADLKLREILDETGSEG